MKNKVTYHLSNLKGNQLLSSSFLMLIGMNFYNFGQFVYHFIAGRMLGTSSYGDLATLITILGFFAIVQNAVGLTIVKYIASIKGENERKGFIKWVILMNFWGGLFIGTLFIISTPLLSKFLNIQEIGIFLLFGPILWLYLLASSVRSVLQGLLQFKQYILSFLTESIVKTILIVVLVALGLKLIGAVVSILIGTIASLLVAFLTIKKYLNVDKLKPVDFSALLKYSMATLFQGLALTSMYSMDLVLVKHFFNSADAGIYASVAVLGRVVFFGATPIAHVTFPMIAGRHRDRKPYNNLLYLSILLVGFFCTIITIGYLILPKLAINLLFGGGFLEGAPYLWLYGVFMSFLAIAMILTQFFLSIGKTKVISVFMGAAILQIILILMYHQNIGEVIKASILSAALLDIILFVYLSLINHEKATFSHSSSIQARKNHRKRS
jgi:O-antigen/teichoic acid export membrane protein